jgi:hypothetical protein
VTITPIVVRHPSKTATHFSDRPCTRMPRLVSLVTLASGCWRRKTCNQLHDIQALMRYMVFDHWDHLMDFMIRDLELESQCNTS